MAISIHMTSAQKQRQNEVIRDTMGTDFLAVASDDWSMESYPTGDNRVLLKVELVKWITEGEAQAILNAGTDTR